MTPQRSIDGQLSDVELEIPPARSTPISDPRKNGGPTVK